MPSNGHEPPPADPRCDCGGCREFRAITLNPRRERPPVRAVEAPRKKPAKRLRAAG